MPLSPPIAIVGMSASFPDADNLSEFWSLLMEGRECIGSKSKVEQDGGTADAGHWVTSITEPEDRSSEFDAGLFGLSPREAERLEPQHRIFLQAAWVALEDAGISPTEFSREIGVFGGGNFTSYYSLTGASHMPAALDDMVGADKDYLTLRVAHHLGLQGPAVTVQTACSTSLVAVHLACQALAVGECTAAIAGGVSLTRPRLKRYFFQKGGMFSPDGYCRAFDASAEGTVFTEGVGMVVLMRLSEARALGCRIYSVIRGSAINNDGGSKASFMAPSIAGQERVLRSALARAGLTAADIGYVEAHGTATVLGDAIELAALTRVHRECSTEVGYCRLGSVKTNIGHTTAAAGVAGLIKASLAVQSGIIPANVNFNAPNPDLDFETSPFLVSAKQEAWLRDRAGRRLAGVSSFGVGGTNAHVIVENPPRQGRARAQKSTYVLTLSAASNTALAKIANELKVRLRGVGRSELADIAFTLNVGRRDLAYRSAVVCHSAPEARRALEAISQSEGRDGKKAASGERMTAFVFPGQGSLYPGAGAGLYQSSAVFRSVVDSGLAALPRDVATELAKAFQNPPQALLLNQTPPPTKYAQPYIFLLETALARTMIAWGVTPTYLLGHSVGELAAFCTAGAMTVEEGARLAAVRGDLMQAMAPGSMLSIFAAYSQIEPLWPDELDLAAINSPRQCVASGPTPEIENFAELLKSAGIPCAILNTSHAFHSRMMDASIDEFRKYLKDFKFKKTNILVVSSGSGNLVRLKDFEDPEYWIRQIRSPVNFLSGVESLFTRGVDFMLEVGPGRQMAGLIQQSGSARLGVKVASLMHNDGSRPDEWAVLLSALAQFWAAGGRVHWRKTYDGERRTVASLPAYPFDAQKYDRVNPQEQEIEDSARRPLNEWVYEPIWRRLQISPPPVTASDDVVVLLDNGDQFGDALAQTLKERGQNVLRLEQRATGFETGTKCSTVDVVDHGSVEQFFLDLKSQGIVPTSIIHALTLAPQWPARGQSFSALEASLLSPMGETASFDLAQKLGVQGLAVLFEAFRAQFGRAPLNFEIVTQGIFDVTGDEALRPANASVLAFAKVAPQEHPNITCRVLDLGQRALSEPSAAARAVFDSLGHRSESALALRGDYWWSQTYNRTLPAADASASTALRKGGVYLITGGLGHIGFILAEYLAKTWSAKLILVGRTPIDASRVEDRDGLTDPRVIRLEKLKRLGAELLYVASDLGSVERARDVIHQAELEYGKIDGVFYGAGAVELRHPVEAVDPEIYNENYSGKVHGLANLMAATADHDFDFALVLSSISTVLGGFGLCSYSAANHIADCLVHATHRGRKSVWSTVDFDLWAGAHFTAEEERQLSMALSRAILPDDGGALFERLMRSNMSRHVIVSTYDLNSRVKAWVKKGGPTHVSPGELHNRPNLETEYSAPVGEIETLIAQVWGEILGINKIGRDDDFFEMGGHSFLAVQIAVRLQEILPEHLTLPNHYDLPTVRSLAEAIEANLRNSTRAIDFAPF